MNGIVLAWMRIANAKSTFAKLAFSFSERSPLATVIVNHQIWGCQWPPLIFHCSCTSVGTLSLAIAWFECSSWSQPESASPETYGLLVKAKHSQSFLNLKRLIISLFFINSWLQCRNSSGVGLRTNEQEAIFKKLQRCKKLPKVGGVHSPSVPSPPSSIGDTGQNGWPLGK